MGGELPQGVPRGQSDVPETALDDPVHCSGVDEHCRLGVLREHEILLGPLPSELGYGESQNVIRLFEHAGGLGVGACQRTAHPDVLGALSWEEKCEAHGV